MSEQSETSENSKVSKANASAKQPLVAKLTAVEKTAKVKDPRKVELGKRLAKISKEAKERKARERQLEADKVKKREQTEMTDCIDFRYLVGFAGLVSTIGCLCFAYKNDKREEKNREMDQKDDDEINKCNVNEKNRESGLQNGPSRFAIENL